MKYRQISRHYGETVKMMEEFGWLRQLIKDMKESLKTGLRFTPSDRDIDNLEEILRKSQNAKIPKKQKSSAKANT